jgi:hypothetical protein
MAALGVWLAGSLLGETLAGGWLAGDLRARQASREVLMLKEAGRVAITAAWLVTKLEAKAEGLVDVRMSEVLYRY